MTSSAMLRRGGPRRFSLHEASWAPRRQGTPLPLAMVVGAVLLVITLVALFLGSRP